MSQRPSRLPPKVRWFLVERLPTFAVIVVVAGGVLASVFSQNNQLVITPVTLLLTSLTAGSLAWLWRRIPRQAKRRDEIIRERAQALRRMIDETRELTTELEDYLTARLAALEELESRVATQERLAALTKEQSQAIDQLIGKQFERSGRVALWQQVVFMVGGVVLGIAATYAFQALVN